MTAPAPNADDAFAHCRALVAEADEDFHLSIPYAPVRMRAWLAALFGFAIELRRVPAMVREAPLGEIRLQWHREALGEIVAGKSPRAHPVIALLAASGLVPAARARLETMIDARARLFYEPAFKSVDDLRAFLRGAEAPIAMLALGEGDPRLLEAAQGLGEAHALARLAPAFAPALAREAASAALDLYRRHARALGGLSSEALGAVAWLALTPGHAARPDGRAWPLMKRLTLLRAVAAGRL